VSKRNMSMRFFEVVGERISKVKATELLELYKFAGD